MSYSTVNRCANDLALLGRVTACVAQEQVTDPPGVAPRLMWPISAATDIEAAYASALAANNPAPGADETVVTDAMILSAVQANLSGP